MEEYATYRKEIMKNIRFFLRDYKKKHGLTNQAMSIKCDLSISEYDKIMNINLHSKHGCSVDTLYKICKNLGINYNDIFNF